MSVFREMHEPFLSSAQGDELLNNDAVVQSQSRLAASGTAKRRTPASKATTRKPKSGNKTKASLEAVMEVSRRLNELEDARNEAARQQRLREEADQQCLREQRWAEVKARMKARNTPLPSARSCDWGPEADDDAVADVQNTDSTALLATRDENGHVVSGTRREVITWYQKVWYAMYNFVQYFTLAASFAPGVLYKANDPDMYYRRREYND